MMLRPVLGALLQPTLCCSMKQHRNLRPSIRIGKDTFQLRLDVHHYNKDQIRVKAHTEYVTIEGKHEKCTQQGYILRQFLRKFKLPSGCDPSKIKSQISGDGILTITAPRSFSDLDTPTEVVMVPITYGPTDKKKKEDAKSEDPKPEDPKSVKSVNPCDKYIKITPLKKK